MFPQSFPNDLTLFRAVPLGFLFEKDFFGDVTQKLKVTKVFIYATFLCISDWNFQKMLKKPQWFIMRYFKKHSVCCRQDISVIGDSLCGVFALYNVSFCSHYTTNWGVFHSIILQQGRAHTHQCPCRTASCVRGPFTLHAPNCALVYYVYVS